MFLTIHILRTNLDGTITAVTVNIVITNDTLFIPTVSST
jgi:hypothetical protein